MADDPDTYDPEPTALGDGEVFIADPIELAELTDALAFMCDQGELFVLSRKTGKWINVEDALNASRTGEVKAFPRKQ